jgi:hypothetical protein
MIEDRYHGQHSTTSEVAISAFENAVFAVIAYRPAAGPLKEALAADANMAAPLALKGLGAILLGKAEDLAIGRAALKPAQEALRLTDGGTATEKALVDALGFASHGALKRAASRLETYLTDAPRDVLCLKLANALRFMTGEPGRMVAVTGAALPAWRPEDPGYGFVLGMHSFGLEETGNFAEAEAIGLQAVTLEREDAWGIHALSHVMEMRGRTKEGSAWIEASRDLWPKCNNFGFHLAWHLALFRLENVDYDAVLDLYDNHIRPIETDDFRDVSNAVSLLWRLGQEGVDVGDRWAGLHDIARRRRTDTAYVFASLHYLLALIGAGDHAAARGLVANLCARAMSVDDEQAEVAAQVGYATARLILENRDSPMIRDICDIALRLPAIGGSLAQRDVFLRTLIMIAADRGDVSTFDSLMRLRGRSKAHDRFVRIGEHRLHQVQIARGMIEGLGPRSLAV